MTSSLRVSVVGGSAVVLCLLPVFLVGSMATFIQADLDLGAASLGLAVALYRAAGAVTSPVMGRHADRFDTTSSLRLATAAAATASLGVAVASPNQSTLIAWLMLAGCSGALAQPAANRLLATAVASGGLGTAFGIKQSAPPVASTLAGLCVPFIAVTIGWRWAFTAAAVLAATMAIRLRPLPPIMRPEQAGNPSQRAADRTSVLLLSSAFGLGTCVSSSITTFFVSASVDVGTEAVVAGTMLATAGVLAAATRIAAGVVSDRVSRGHLRGCAALAAVGALGVASLSVAESVPAQGLGVVIALMGTWGFNGVFWFALIKAYPLAPGGITGAVAPGALLGSTIGPIAFGLVVESAGYSVAFQVFTAVACACALNLLAANRRLPTPSVV